MSRPTKFDPQFSSISYGCRDPALYPNVLAPFDAAACEVLGSLVRCPDKSICDDDRTSGSEDNFQMQDEGSQETFAEGAEDEELGRWSLLRRELSRNSSYDAGDERPFKVAKPQISIQRRPQNPSRHSSLPIAKTIALDFAPKTNDRASIFPNSPKDAPYLLASEARRAASINAVAVYALGHKERSVADGRWNAIYTPASPPALIPTCEPDAQTLTICIGISEARSAWLPRRCYPRRISVEEAKYRATAQAQERRGKVIIKHPNPTQPIQPKRNFFRKLIHPKELPIAKGWNLLIDLKNIIHNKICPSKFEIPRTSEHRKWQARRRKPIFSGKWVQSIAKAVGGRKRGRTRAMGIEGMGLFGEEDGDE